MAPKVLRHGTTATAVAVILLLVVAVRTAGAGRPAPADGLHAVNMRATTAMAAAAAATKPPDQTPLMTTDGARHSGCTSDPHNGGGPCPSPHGHTSSRDSTQTTN
ncbi:hypothetical protein BS78_01G149500 [Paspalum vaginatum]|nr:hypothetical protein BS78_01G149500 [Paspalum vaginatum]